MALTTAAVIGSIGAGASIAGGFAAKKQARKAARAAADSLEAAKRKLEVRRMEQLQVPLDSYELEQQALVAGQQQAIEGLRESGQRAVQGGLPALQAQVQAGAESIRQDQAKAIFDREKLIVDEQKTADAQLANLDLSTAQGAQMAAAQADESAAQQFTSGIKGLAGVGQTMYERKDLYDLVENRNNISVSELDDGKIIPVDDLLKNIETRKNTKLKNDGTIPLFQPGNYQPFGNFNQRFPGINDSFDGLRGPGYSQPYNFFPTISFPRN